MTGPPERNLLILHTARFQDLADWIAVKERIEARAPDIEVRIGDNLRHDDETAGWQASRPSLVFSPLALHRYRPPGGRVYAGQFIGKGLEWLHLAQAGLPVPRTARLTPDLSLDLQSWGEYVIVKPALGMLGRDVRLLRTDQVAARCSQLTQDGQRRMLVQQFVDHVDADGRPFAYRILTVFGEPLYMSEWRWAEKRPPLPEIAADPEGTIASNARGVARDRRLVALPDVLALVRQVGRALNDIPCLGQDVVRQTGTGRLFVIETNPGGYTWHLSSNHSRRPGYDPDFASAKYAQFGALDVLAEQLIARTRAEAR
jgi:hypothetical protein